MIGPVELELDRHLCVEAAADLLSGIEGPDLEARLLAEAADVGQEPGQLGVVGQALERAGELAAQPSVFTPPH